MKIKEMTGENMTINGTYYVSYKENGVAKNGNEYISVTLIDNTGSVSGKIWDFTDETQAFEKGEVVSVNGITDSYKGKVTLKITAIKPLDSGYKMKDFIPMTSRNGKEMMQYIEEMIVSIKNEPYRKLVEAFYHEKEFMVSFSWHGASSAANYGAYGGGLLEVVYRQLHLASVMEQLYQEVDHSLLIAAILLRSVARVEEYTSLPTVDLTERGRLLGGLQSGITAVLKKAQAERIELSDAEETYLLHMLSCGFYEASKKPGIIEGIMLCQIEMTERAIMTAENLIQNSQSEIIYSSDIPGGMLMRHQPLEVTE